MSVTVFLCYLDALRFGVSAPMALPLLTGQVGYVPRPYVNP